jgi:lipid-A-disaccharide synthase
MPSPPGRVLIAAGEPSGDAHGAAVVRELRRIRQDVEIEAFGGPALAAAGARIRFPMERYTVLGFGEALGKIPAHLALLHTLGRDLRQGRYDLVILVDYPGFNLRLAALAKRAGVRTLYYIAPQLWAWRAGRARTLRTAVDRLAVILPFEEAFFKDLDVPAEFVGHPLLDGQPPSREVARAQLGVGGDERVLTLFPGSRAQEVHRIWPAFRDAARLLLADGLCDRVLVASLPGFEYGDPGPIELREGGREILLAAADAGLLKSGTTTLQGACVGLPMIVGYRVHPLTAAIARRVKTIPWISLVNIVANREVVPELTQDEAHPGALADRLRPLLVPGGPEAATQRADLAGVRQALGSPGAAARVARMANELLAA